MSDEIRESSSFWRLISAATAAIRDAVLEGFRKIAAIWPHGLAEGLPAPRGNELDAIGQWLKIPRPMNGQVPLSDPAYLSILKDPFAYHALDGTEAGLIRAVTSLGYTNVTYLQWSEVNNPPTWTPPNETVAVASQNCFGLRSDNFPANWISTDPIPSGESGRRIRAILDAVNKHKRASATFWEVRVGESKVVTQAWWNGSQDLENIEYVSLDGAYVTAKR